MDLAADGHRWAIATPHTAATRAGAAAFEAGGNAFDATLCAAITLAVVYPQACGVGGDLFALLERAENRSIVAINSSGRSPRAIDPGAVRAAHAAMPDRGPLTITVPGAAAGWKALCDQGARFEWGWHFADAIRHAGDGIALARGPAATLAEDAVLLSADPGLAEVFFPGGTRTTAGDPVRQPALARTLATLAAEGIEALYGGVLGRAYADGLRAAGSPITIEDLAAHRAELVPPLVGRFHDLDVRVVPPNSQGFVLLEILAGIERTGIDPDPVGSDAATIARIVLAARADRDHHLADPAAMRVHASTLLDDGHLAALVDDVPASEPAATPERPPPAHHGDTVGLTAIDADGNAVSLIQSLYDGFGSGILEPATGIVAHSRGAQFVLDPAHPNVLAPAKRPAHTLMPALAHRGDRIAAVLGTMGGHGQPQINAMNLIRSQIMGMSPGDTLAAPRWLVGGLDEANDHVVAEEGVPGSVLDALAGEGFEILRVASHDADLGQAVLIGVDGDGAFRAGADPRADGGVMAS